MLYGMATKETAGSRDHEKEVEEAVAEEEVAGDGDDEYV